MSLTADAPPVHADRQRILDAVNFTVPAQPLPAGYRLALAVLAAAVLALPIGLAVFVTFLVWLVGWHIYQSVAWLNDGPYFVFHLPMALVGGLLLVFILKPLFLGKRDKKSDVILLTRETEPLLFEFVTKLATAVGAPAPVRIEVDCEPNAAAHLSMGMIGLLKRRLTLRIGLPLVTGLPLRQFAGVLAHEFGHFNQRNGMTATVLIRMVMMLLARIVFERDKVDLKLQAMGASRDGLARLVYWIVMLLVEAGRGVLWVMLLIGELLCSRVMRKMEFDADRLEAIVSGSSQFVATDEAIILLNVAAGAARRDLASAWEQKRLADDLPRLIAANAERLGEDRANILKVLSEQPRRLFDTHPSHDDRCKHALSLAQAGLLTIDARPADLFANFAGLCKAATAALYTTLAGEEARAATLVTTDALAGERAEQIKAGKALDRYLAGFTTPECIIVPGLDALSAPDSPDAAARELGEVRITVDTLAGDTRLVVQRMEDSTIRLLVANHTAALVDLYDPSSERAKIRRKAVKDADQHRAVVKSALEETAKLAGALHRRFTLGLQLLQVDQIAERIPARHADPRATARHWLDVSGRLYALQPQVEQMHGLAMRIEVFMQAYNDKQPYPPLVNNVLQDGKSIRKLLEELQTGLMDMPYPFEHGSGAITMAAAMITALPPEGEPLELHKTAVTFVQRYYITLHRAMSHLSELAEATESALGMHPLTERKQSEVIAKERAAEAKSQERKYWLWYGLRALGGSAMVVVLMWMSISPPDLPSFGWGPDGGPVPQGYRPASFSSQIAYTPPAYSPSPTGPGMARVTMPSTGPQVIYNGGSFTLSHQPGPSIPSANGFPSHWQWSGQPVGGAGANTAVRGYQPQQPGVSQPRYAPPPPAYGSPSANRGYPPNNPGGTYRPNNPGSPYGGSGGGRPGPGGGGAGGPPPPAGGGGPRR